MEEQYDKINLLLFKKENKLNEKDIEEYLLTLPKMETQTSKNSAIQIAKDMCRSASTGINEIQNIARKLQGKLQSHNLDLQTEKQEQEK